LVGVEQPTVASLTLWDRLATAFDLDEAGELIRDRNGVLCRRLGLGDVGIVLRTSSAPGVEWTATLTGIDAQHTTVTATDVETGDQVPGVRCRRGEEVLATVTLPRPGLYRVRVSGGTRQ
jgi:hypothetical protein